MAHDAITLRVAARYRRAEDEAAALEALALQVCDAWLDAFLGEAQLEPATIDKALTHAGLTADAVNSADPQAKTAGALDWIKALGGTILKATWHALLAPFVGVYRFIASPDFRQQVKKSFTRALRHEIRSSRHMVEVAARLAAGQEVNPQERKAAMAQLIDILTKIVLIYLAGPHVVGLFSGGIWKFLGALMSPLDDVVFILFDKPIRAATRKLLGSDIGMLPSGFYTHFA